MFSLVNSQEMVIPEGFEKLVKGVMLKDRRHWDYERSNKNDEVKEKMSNVEKIQYKEYKDKSR